MKNIITLLRGILLAFCCLQASQLLGQTGPNGSPATIYTDVRKTVISLNELTILDFKVTNPTASAISNISVQISLPAGCTINPVTPPAGTTYNSGTGVWSFTTALAANSSRTLSVSFTYNGTSNKILVVSGTFISGSTGSSEVDVLVSCPIINWYPSGVTLNNRVTVSMNDTSYYDANNQYTENLASQGVAVVFSAYRQNTPVNGTPQYSARFGNSMNTDSLGKAIILNNATLPNTNPSGNAPYTIVDVNGVVDTSKITDTPPNFLQTMFTFDPTTYVNGVGGVSFYIRNIDSRPTPGWQSAVIVYGTDVNGNQVPPVTTFAGVSRLYDILNTPYSLVIAGKCLGTSTGLACYIPAATFTDTAALATYSFSANIRSFTIRFFRNSQINQIQSIYLSNIFGGCPTDLALRLTVPDAVECERCFTYTVSATNNGPNDVGTATVQGVLPTGLTVTAATPSKGTFDPLTGIWTIGSLIADPQETETLVIDVCATQSTISWDMILVGNGEQTVSGNNEVQKTISVNYIVVHDDVVATLKNTPVDINWAANDSSIGGTLDLNSFNYTPSPDGTVTILSPGIIRFTPNFTFAGNVSIPYTVSDSNGCEGSATIHIMVSDVIIRPPQAFNYFGITQRNTPITIPVLLNDLAGSAPLNPASVTIVTPPSNGLITNVNPATGEVTYAPHIGFIGEDSFVYQVCDTNGFCAQATVYVTVQGPVAPCPTVCTSDCCPTT